MAKRLFDRLKESVVRLGDPDRAIRIDEHARELERELKARGREFDVDDVLSSLDARRMEYPWIVARTYERALMRVWRDGNITGGERRALE